MTSTHKTHHATAFLAVALVAALVFGIIVLAGGDWLPGTVIVVASLTGLVRTLLGRRPELPHERHAERVPPRLAEEGPELDGTLPLRADLRHRHVRSSARASSACSVFPGSRRPTSRCASAPAAMSFAKSIPVS